jgi:hypothetical protein
LYTVLDRFEVQIRSEGFEGLYLACLLADVHFGRLVACTSCFFLGNDCHVHFRTTEL